MILSSSVLVRIFLEDVRMENDEIACVFKAMYLLTNVQLVENGELDENQIPVKR